MQIYLLKLKTSRSQLYQKLRTRAKHHFSQNRVIRKKTTLKLCLPVETHRKMRMRKNGAPPAAPPQLLQLSSWGVSKTDPARKPNAIQHLSWPKINSHLYEARDLYVHARYIVFLKGTLKET